MLPSEFSLDRGMLLVGLLFTQVYFQLCGYVNDGGAFDTGRGLKG